MRYVQINTVPSGSTGAVVRQVAEERRAAGDDCWLMWGRGRAAEGEREFDFGTRAGVCLDALQTRLDGRAGFHSKAATRRLLRKLDGIDPDVVHLHNLHGYYVNVEMLFGWLASRDCQVRWTLHDCWAFTGHCAHFTYAKCAQWKSRCAYGEPCRQTSTYPKTVSKHHVAKSFEDKRRVFTSVPPERMEIITPSRWLADLVAESFLKNYPVTVRHNEVDKTVFKPTPSDFRERHGIGDRFMVLGVASPWTERKGLPDFVRLARELDSDRFAVVLVGLSRGQIRQLEAEFSPKGRQGREPSPLVALPRTDSAAELAEAYTAADVFVHPGVEETFGMTVAEAQACGTPVVVAKGSACEEAADPALAKAVPPDMSTLRATVVRLAGDW